MSTYTPRLLDEIRSRLTLSDIIGKRVRLVRAGREFKGCCPFHKEKTPSFYVNDDKNFYHCFGCGAHGDVIGFTMQHDNNTFPEAVEQLANLAGVEIPKQSPAEYQKAKQEKSLYNLLEDTAKFFEESLYKSKNYDALSYMKKRNIPDEIMHSFRIGYAPSDGNELIKYLKNLDYNDNQMIEAGIARKSSKDGKLYSFFRDRIIFPVSDRRGRIVAFGGRILPEYIRPNMYAQSRTPPKYINSSDNPLFHKGSMLYGESHARQAAIDGQSPIVVEGYVDVMACYQVGYKGAVAPLGTALTQEQILNLWKMIPDSSKTPYLCFDGDEAGRRAAARACDRILPLLKPNHSAKIVFLPDGQDPDSLIRGQGKEAFSAILKSSISLIDFLWNQKCANKNFDTPEAKAGLAKELDDIILKIEDRNIQYYYRQEIRKKLNAKFKQPFKNNRKNRINTIPAIKITKPANSQARKQKMILLATLINHPDIFEHIEDKISLIKIQDEALDNMRQYTISILSSETMLDSDALKMHLKAKGFDKELEILHNSGIYTHAAFARPNSETEKAIEGWLELWEFIENSEVINDLKQAARALRDLNEENQNRFMELHKIHINSNE